MKEELQKIVQNLPSKPGVYRFYDQRNLLLYIGKAKNLKKRVSSYFQKNSANQRLKILVSQISYIEYTIVKTEIESLLLEANLIKAKQPKYNVKLKDDKSYIYLKFSNDPIPGIFLVRKKTDQQSFYLGPFTNHSSISKTLRSIRVILPYCQNRFFGNKYCSYVSIRQCLGICKKEESLKEYKERLENIKKILQGQTQQILDLFQKKMQEAIKIQNFPLASMWRDNLRELSSLISQQKVVLPIPETYTLITILRYVSIERIVYSTTIQEIFEGKIININNFIQNNTGPEGDLEIQLNLILQEINHQNKINSSIILKYQNVEAVEI
jgi:excinuclease ABC subunit C